MTRARTPVRIRCVTGRSVCWATACRASSSGSAARTKVANCRVISARSRPPMRAGGSRSPRRKRSSAELMGGSIAGCVAIPRRSPTSSTETGSHWRSRNSWRTCRGLSASSTPRCSRPAGSSAWNSKAGIVRQSSRVTRSTSSSVVVPRRTFPRPSSRMDGVSPRACRSSCASDAPSWIRVRIASSTGTSS